MFNDRIQIGYIIHCNVEINNLNFLKCFVFLIRNLLSFKLKTNNSILKTNLFQKFQIFYTIFNKVLSYDNFNMSFGNQRPLSSHLYSNFSPQFVPWSQQAPQILNMNNSLNPLSQISSPFLPPNFFVQQQNNYYNSNFSYQPNFPLPMHQSLLPPPISNTPWMFNSLHAKPKNNLQKNKKESQIICLDQDSPINPVIVIDSAEEEIEKKALIEQKQVIVQKKEIKMQVDKLIPQKLQKKQESVLSEKRQSRLNKQIQQTNRELTKKISKKRISYKQKFTYKLTSHERKLMQLYQYRDYFPHQIVTGPQFQARLPHLRRSSGNSKDWLAIRRQRLLQRRQIQFPQ